MQRTGWIAARCCWCVKCPRLYCACPCACSFNSLFTIWELTDKQESINRAVASLHSESYKCFLRYLSCGHQSLRWLRCDTDFGRILRNAHTHRTQAFASAGASELDTSDSRHRQPVIWTPQCKDSIVVQSVAADSVHGTIIQTIIQKGKAMIFENAWRSVR